MSENHNQPEYSQPPQYTQSAARSTLGVPIAIVIAAALIAGAIIYTGSNGKGGTQVANNTKTAQQETKDITVDPITAEDHIRGNPNAPILIVEYSDFDCPFCKNFHETMNKIMTDFGPEGKVAWVYRQFPIEQLHPNAPKVARASECVADIGGNDAFWKFSDLVFGERSTNEPTNLGKLTEFATRSGVSESAFTDCFNSDKFTDKISKSIESAVRAGARGTPYSIMIVGNQQGVINGAQPYPIVKQMVETMIKQLDGEVTATE